MTQEQKDHTEQILKTSKITYIDNKQVGGQHCGIPLVEGQIYNDEIGVTIISSSKSKFNLDLKLVAMMRKLIEAFVTDKIRL